MSKVAVLGGGLAGIAAATALATRGFDVEIHEARGRLGGRAGSFQDAISGETIDTCQHVSMGCCTNLAFFCETAGIGDLLEPQPFLQFMTKDRRVSRFGADRLPAPFHLARSFWRAHYLSAMDKVRIAWGLSALAFANDAEDPPFQDWLRRHGQTERTMQRFWALVLTSALNESLDRIGLRYARKVFRDGFLTHPRAFEVYLPTVPLGELYGSRLTPFLNRHGIRVQLGAAGKQLRMVDGRVDAILLRDGGAVAADWHIVAVPFDRLLELIPERLREADPYFRDIARLEVSPITSVHLWYSQPVLEDPHRVLVDCLGQWVFQRAARHPGEHYVQVVVSAARELRPLGHAEMQDRIVAEMEELFPAASRDKLLRARVVTERAATFSAVPGVDQWRPTQESPIPNLVLAGDWTLTGWPATMEGAVRSGYLAAEVILRKSGMPERLVQPDLGAELIATAFP